MGVIRATPEGTEGNELMEWSAANLDGSYKRLEVPDTNNLLHDAALVDARGDEGGKRRKGVSGHCLQSGRLPRDDNRPCGRGVAASCGSRGKEPATKCGGEVEVHPVPASRTAHTTVTRLDAKSAALPGSVLVYGGRDELNDAGGTLLESSGTTTRPPSTRKDG